MPMNWLRVFRRADATRLGHGYTPRAADESGAARQLRPTPRRGVGRNARDRRMFCPRVPWVH
jgi:hypothetical protein